MKQSFNNLLSLFQCLGHCPAASPNFYRASAFRPCLVGCFGNLIFPLMASCLGIWTFSLHCMSLLGWCFNLGLQFPLYIIHTSVVNCTVYCNLIIIILLISLCELTVANVRKLLFILLRCWIQLWRRAILLYFTFYSFGPEPQSFTSSLFR